MERRFISLSVAGPELTEILDRFHGLVLAGFAPENATVTFSLAKTVSDTPDFVCDDVYFADMEVWVTAVCAPEWNDDIAEDGNEPAAVLELVLKEIRPLSEDVAAEFDYFEAQQEFILYYRALSREGCLCLKEESAHFIMTSPDGYLHRLEVVSNDMDDGTVYAEEYRWGMRTVEAVPDSSAPINTSADLIKTDNSPMQRPYTYDTDAGM